MICLYQIFGVLVVMADVCCFLQWEMCRNQNNQVAPGQQDQTDCKILLPVQQKIEQNAAEIIKLIPHIRGPLH